MWTSNLEHSSRNDHDLYGLQIKGKEWYSTAKHIVVGFTHHNISLKFSQVWLIPYNEVRIPLYRALKVDLKKLEAHIIKRFWNPPKVDLSSCMNCPCELSICPPGFESFEVQVSRRFMRCPYSRFYSNLKKSAWSSGLATSTWKKRCTNLTTLNKFEERGVILTSMGYKAFHSIYHHFKVLWSLKKFYLHLNLTLVVKGFLRLITIAIEVSLEFFIWREL